MEIFTCKFMFFVTCIYFTFQMFSFSIFLSLYSVILHEVEGRFMEW